MLAMDIGGGGGGCGVPLGCSVVRGGFRRLCGALGFCFAPGKELFPVKGLVARGGDGGTAAAGANGFEIPGDNSAQWQQPVPATLAGYANQALCFARWCPHTSSSPAPRAPLVGFEIEEVEADRSSVKICRMTRWVSQRMSADARVGA